jgi:hypothetical protein
MMDYNIDVIVNDGQDYQTTWGEFLQANGDMEVEDIRQIAAALNTGQTCTVGGVTIRVG